MHVEFLVEDRSTQTLLDIILPRIWGAQGELHTWRTHPYKGTGKIPAGLSPKGDPKKRILTEQLPRLFMGYKRNPGVGAVVVVLDADDRDCGFFLSELKKLAAQCGMGSKVMFRLAIEETEAWYLGDRNAITVAYPKADLKALRNYRQDKPCETWETLADALYPGGRAAVKKRGWPLPGQLKFEWAKRIGPFLAMEANQSPSFNKFLNGLRRL